MALIVTLSGGTSGGGGPVPSHNSLSGLQGSGPEYIHLSQAEYNALLGGERKSSTVSIGSGSDTVTVNFGTPYTVTTYKILFNFMNLVDVTPDVLTGVVVARTLSSFTVKLTGIADSANYTMNWLTFI